LEGAKGEKGRKLGIVGKRISIEARLYKKPLKEKGACLEKGKIWRRERKKTGLKADFKRVGKRKKRKKIRPGGGTPREGWGLGNTVRRVESGLGNRWLVDLRQEGLNFGGFRPGRGLTEGSGEGHLLEREVSFP